MENNAKHFQLTDNYIKTYQLNLNEKIPENAVIDFDCKISVTIVKIETKGDLKIGQLDMNYFIQLRDKERNLGNINLIVQALFSISNRVKNEDFEKLIKYKGAPMLSQIVRAYITSNTALSGMPTIKIPMVNFVEFFQKAEKENK